MIAPIVSGIRILCDSLAGILLVITLTSAFPLIQKLLLQLPASVAATKSSLKLHPKLPDVREFHPVECLVLYLVAYPALAMYRSISTAAGSGDGILGCLALAMGLAGVLAGMIGPAMVKFGVREEEEKDDDDDDDDNRGYDDLDVGNYRRRQR
mmetsp:Transcript_19324/g.34980  ORF Transcript_19324/g.34980 Transcript_19324/m.34980 type:complete len:153 (+) Transcript_19324:169-627(+)